MVEDDAAAAPAAAAAGAGGAGAKGVGTSSLDDSIASTSTILAVCGVAELGPPGAAGELIVPALQSQLFKTQVVPWRQESKQSTLAARGDPAVFSSIEFRFELEYKPTRRDSFACKLAPLVGSRKTRAAQSQDAVDRTDRLGGLSATNRHQGPSGEEGQ